MASIVVGLGLVELLDHDHDHWCNRCQLATGIRLFLITRLAENMRLHVHLQCIECGSRDITADPDGRHC